MDIRLAEGFRKATFDRLYSNVELHKSALKVYTKPLFAWRKALSHSHDNRTLYDFARYTLKNLDGLHAELANRSFRFREAVELHYNFRTRHRTFYIFPWEERIVDTLLYRVLTRYFDSAFSPDAYAYRYRGFGVDPCQKRLARTLAQAAGPVHIVKRDVKNYFPSVSHDILLDMLAQWVEPSDYLFELLRQRVQFDIRQPDDTTAAAQQGIPFGTAIACFFANLYLTPLDRAMTQLEGVTYFRYADDILAVCTDAAAADRAEAALEHGFAELKLESKPSHHQRFVLTEVLDWKTDTRDRFRHLGLEFRADGSIGLSRDKGRKIRNLFRFAFRRARRKLRRLHDPDQRAAHACTVAKEIVDRGVSSVAIIDYYLKHIDDEEQLRQLDRWLAEEVLARSFGTGHKKGNFKRMSFRQLRRMGLPSLRHRRRLLRHGHIRSSFFSLRTEKLIEKEKERLPLFRKERFSPGLEAAVGVEPRERGDRL